MNSAKKNTGRKSMKILLIIAHGSRHEEAREELRQLAERVAELTAGRIDQVLLAFLEFDQPDIPAGLAECAAAGAERVDVLPYFLQAGVHVQQHIPQAVEAAKQRFPHTLFELLPHFGAHDAIPNLIAQLPPLSA
jgi:sirohydrochlorin ferrochelatase